MLAIQIGSLVIAGGIALLFSRSGQATWRPIAGVIVGIPVGFLLGVLMAALLGGDPWNLRIYTTSFFFSLFGAIGGAIYGRRLRKRANHQNTPPLPPVVAGDIDLELYKLAADELSSNSDARNEALWYKAFADASGDEQGTKAAYIRLRVEQLRRRADVATGSTSLTSSNPMPSNAQAATTVARSSTQINSWVLGIGAFLVIGIVVGIVNSADDKKQNLKVAQPSNPVPSAPKWKDLSVIPPPQKSNTNPPSSAIGSHEIPRAGFNFDADGNPLVNFDVSGAVKAGYSKSEIAEYLCNKQKIDIAVARGRGYSDDEIIAKLVAE